MNESAFALSVEPHPLLEWGGFHSEFPTPLSNFDAPAAIESLLRGEGEVPCRPSEEHRGAIRRMLRHGGFKPSGRNRPASEYLRKALEADQLGSINPAVDFCNAVSLNSGIPISVVDADKASPPLGLRMAAAGEAYVFNASGQELRLGGLVCLCDFRGPCGSPVKDSQRTKTGPDTVRTLTVVWGAAEFADHTRRAVAWYRELLEAVGVRTSPITTP